MTTEQKIREAFEESGLDFEYEYPFRLGYMALLNELKPVYGLVVEMYRLPEGVTKCS